jgi:hypothetical protein
VLRLDAQVLLHDRGVGREGFAARASIAVCFFSQGLLFLAGAKPKK